MDANIGRVVEAVETAGLTKRTLFIFTSDHGYNVGHHGLCGKGNAGWPLNMFDTSLKIPMIWRMPGTIKAGVKEETLVQVVDFAGSLLEFVGSFAGPDEASGAGYALPAMANSPGLSYAALLKNVSKKAVAQPGGAADPWHRGGRAGNDRATGTVHFGEYGQTRSVRSAKYKYRVTKEGLEELYDLVGDPGEQRNFIGTAAGDRLLASDAVQTLVDRMHRHFALYSDPTKSGWDLPVTGSGQQKKVGWGYGSVGAFSPYGAMASYAAP